MHWSKYSVSAIAESLVSDHQVDFEYAISAAYWWKFRTFVKSLSRFRSARSRVANKPVIPEPDAATILRTWREYTRSNIAPDGDRVKHPQPTRPGYYWAIWTVAEDGTFEGDEQTPAACWCIVEVNHNSGDWVDPCEAEIEDGEIFSVAVPGVRETQWLDNFIWGEFVADLRSN